MCLQEILQSGGKNEIPELKIDQDVLNQLIENYENAIRDTKKSINDEIHSKVKKSIELKRAAKSNSKPQRKRKYNESKKSNV